MKLPFGEMFVECDDSLKDEWERIALSRDLHILNNFLSELIQSQHGTFRMKFRKKEIEEAHRQEGYLTCLEDMLNFLQTDLKDTIREQDEKESHK